ncbi:hypothetical protein EMIT0215P_10066 [Pseudomonas serboccidentalis]
MRYLSDLTVDAHLFERVSRETVIAVGCNTSSYSKRQV